MDYNEQVAKEIIQKHNLAETTLRVWKSRGKIPKRYLNKNFKVGNKAQREQIESLKCLFATGFINRVELARRAEIKPDRLNYISAGGGSLLQEEYILIKKIINKSRLKVKSLNFELLQKQTESEIEKLKNLHANKLLVWNVILGKNLNKYIANLRIGTNVTYPQDERAGQIEQAILEFVYKTQLD